MPTTIQIRRDLAANWTSVNPILADGELGLESDTTAYKIGNGVATWTTLPYRNLSPSVTTLLMAATTDPSPPAAGYLNLYAKDIGGRILPKWVGPSGLDTSIQPFLGANKIGMLCPPGNAVTVSTLGAYTAPTATGTAVTRTVATTNLFTRMRRVGFTTTATAGTLAGARVAAAQITTGGATASGFYKQIRFGISDTVLVAGARMFVGISATTSAPTNVEPSTLTNSIGIGHGAANTNLFLYYGGSTAQTPINLGVNFPTNTINTDVYELILFTSPISSDVSYRVSRLNTSDVASGVLANGGGVSLPSTTTLLTYLQAWRSNNATAAVAGLDIMSDYIETDY